MFKKVNSIALLERVGMHSHIQSLGMDRIEAEGAGESGLVGRQQERKTLFLLLRLAETHKSRIILITGPSGTGKSALEHALTQDLKKKGIPAKTISASEMFSASQGKTELLTQAIRESLGIRVQESSKALEGEVVEIVTDREKAASGRVVLKTTDMEAAYTFGAGIMQAMHAERIEVGDVIAVNKSTGTVKRRGRSLSQLRDYDEIGGVGQYLPCPEGEILRSRVDMHTVTLHEIDVLNSSQSMPQAAAGEIPTEVRESVDSTMREWIEEGRGELVTGVLFINESELLDIECYSYLNMLSEVSVSPVIVLSSNKAQCRVRGSAEVGKCGMPADFYSRVLEIELGEYAGEEVREIVRVRAKEESDRITQEGVEAVGRLAEKHGLRYAFNILSALDVYSRRVEKEVGEGEVKEVSEIFPGSELECA